MAWWRSDGKSESQKAATYLLPGIKFNQYFIYTLYYRGTYYVLCVLPQCTYMYTVVRNTCYSLRI